MSGFDYLKNFLEEEGFRYKLEDDIASFKFQGVPYYTFNNEDNPYLQIIVVCKFKEHSIQDVLRICNDMNKEKFIVKFIARNSETVWASYEFMPNQYTDGADFERIFDMLDKTSDDLINKLG